MKASQGGPARSVTRKPGTHQVEMSTPRSAARPNSELQGPGGAKHNTVFPARALARRNARCVIRIMIQMKGPPKNAKPIIKTKAVASKKWERKTAANIPALEASTADTGMPSLLKRPSAAGA